MKASWSSIVCGLSFFLSLFASSGIAQTMGTLRGTVSDLSGAMVPQAKMAVLQEGTGVRRTGTSSEQESHEFAVLSLGLYTLLVKRAGLQSYERQSINMTIGRVAIADAAGRDGAGGV